MAEGAITLFSGPMFSGKTDALIQAFRIGSSNGASVVAIKPAVDTRHSPTEIVSHSGASVPAVAVREVAEIASAATAARAVFIDEVQFFDPSIVAAVTDLSRAGVSVIVAGLDLDFRREPFVATAELARIATEVKALQGTCTRCGRPAAFTQRLLNGAPARLTEPVIRVGDDELYEPRCAQCWEEERDAFRPEPAALMRPS